MADPRDVTNTKVESVVESLEAMIVAVFARVAIKPPPKGSFEAVTTSRAELKTALHELLKPVLRVASEQ